MEQAEVKMKKNKKSKKGGFDGGYGGGSYTDSGTGGGGYMQSPGGFGSPSATQGERKSRSRSQQIVPCTVSQLLSAAQVDEVFKIREVELSQVTIVGVVRHAEKAPTNILYKVDDMTAAPMDVRQWVDTDEAGSENVVVPPGSYVKVAGHLRSFQNKKSLVAFKIMPLEDMNEFISHMLEVVHAHMLLNKVQTMPAGGGASHGLTTPVRPGTADMGGGYTGASDMYVNGLTPHQSQVLNLIKSCRAAEGMSIQELKNRLKGMNIMTIKQAVEFLSNEGHIYSTVDEDHYRSTDAD
ncbi:replication protein A 32 kDa subunit isoform X2 [Protopterus annectens]|uniref:replication protein A 32 kDa subunit isoform X2 n=1 Tax=Protopterus annectens TaxID=7888 RepID=UPI001CF9795C|nr:replication protein A 32 kDa subunit isoform X2 [Protopterus annectens]